MHRARPPRPRFFAKETVDFLHQNGWKTMAELVEFDEVWCFRWVWFRNWADLSFGGKNALHEAFWHIFWTWTAERCNQTTYIHKPMENRTYINHIYKYIAITLHDKMSHSITQYYTVKINYLTISKMALCYNVDSNCSMSIGWSWNKSPPRPVPPNTQRSIGNSPWRAKTMSDVREKLSAEKCDVTNSFITIFITVS